MAAAERLLGERSVRPRIHGAERMQTPPWGVAFRVGDSLVTQVVTQVALGRTCCIRREQWWWWLGSAALVVASVAAALVVVARVGGVGSCGSG